MLLPHALGAFLLLLTNLFDITFLAFRIPKCNIATATIFVMLIIMVDVSHNAHRRCVIPHVFGMKVKNVNEFICSCGRDSKWQILDSTMTTSGWEGSGIYNIRVAENQSINRASSITHHESLKQYTQYWGFILTKCNALSHSFPTDTVEAFSRNCYRMNKFEVGSVEFYNILLLLLFFSSSFWCYCRYL